MKYLPNEVLRREMLSEIGISDLFSDLPQNLRIELELPSPLSEIEVRRELERILKKNKKILSFLGAGCYNHYIPSVVKELVRRSEFYTSYTPYQPELSQGMLQALFEYQSLMAELLEMDIVNSSMYDWSTSLSEAALMCLRVTSRREFLIPKIISHERRGCLKTYTASKLKILEVEHDERGQLSLEDLKSKLSQKTCGVYLEYPYFYGFFEEKLKEISEMVHENGSLFLVGVDPMSLGILKPPEADIVVGEAQGLGNSMNFGGPLLGIFAIRDSRLVRKMPGRLIGMTQDLEGERGYIMTLQTREQHIRRGRATSNICTNEALCALSSAIYLSLMGRQGLKEMAELCMRNANYTMERIKDIEGFTSPLYDSIHFKEFTVAHDKMRRIDARLLSHKIQGGFLLDEKTALYCVTEMHSREDVERLLKALREVSL
ncbi:MAG: aminomethyl-transferring glycine dehydrogenase subunit GcvPA [Candidatus Methanofastidiosia archaeon]